MHDHIFPYKYTESIYPYIHIKMECTPKTVTFNVTRKNPELITPAGPTPHELKPLSDIDDQETFRLMQIPAIAVFEGSPFMQGIDPAIVIREAIAKALVFYYPFAGRLREIADRKLAVDCTGEGVVFVEADADFTVAELADAGLHPPFPNVDQLLYDYPSSSGIIDCPLIRFQVTRFKCGGFTASFHSIHALADAGGFMQFGYAITQLALGAAAPSISPVWDRHLLSSRNPPRISFPHPEFEVLPNSITPSTNEMAEGAFFFSHSDISALRRNIPDSSKFDVVISCIWRCRTLALSPDPNQEVRLVCAVNTAHLLKNPPLPKGYYGNSVVGTLAVAKAEELYVNPLHYIVELVRKAKGKVNEEYVKSTMDLLSSRGRPGLSLDEWTYVVSDLGHLGGENVDLGWGKPLYSGVAKGWPYPANGHFSWFISCKKNGETGILVPICLPRNAMEVFTEEIKKMIDDARKIMGGNASNL